jgi:hypothetical protein
MQIALLDLQRKLEELEKAQRVVPTVTVDGKRPKYRTPTKEDVADEPVVFTARSVMKVIPSYMDEHGVEVIAPFKIIVMKFAAQDIRMDGKEEDIITFCNYTAHLTPEIEFLRNHPEYNITFGENMNEVAGHNVRDYQFKTAAAAEVAGMSTESVVEHAKMLDISGWQRMSNKQIKDYIVADIVEKYRVENEKLQDDLQKRIFEQTAKIVNQK